MARERARKTFCPDCDAKLDPALAAPPGPPCPECGAPLRPMGRDFKAPRRGDLRGWDKVRAAWSAGRRFGKLPRNGPPPLTRR